MVDTSRSQGLSVAYNQLCTSYHAIDDFRAKLLGFLPLVTGGGLVLLTGSTKGVRKQFFAPMGLLGIFVTLGLLTYELFGIKRCRALIEEGEELEKAMLKNGVEIHRGQFSNRGDQFPFVSKPLAAALIYSAALAAWTYLALYYDHSSLRAVRSREMFIVSFVVIMIYHWWTWPRSTLRKWWESTLGRWWELRRSRDAEHEEIDSQPQPSDPEHGRGRR
jgi:hypothetical protein